MMNDDDDDGDDDDDDDDDLREFASANERVTGDDHECFLKCHKWDTRRQIDVLRCFKRIFFSSIFPIYAC